MEKKYKHITWQEAQDLWDLGVYCYEWCYREAGYERWRPYVPEGQPIDMTYSPSYMATKGTTWLSYRIAVE